MADQTKNAPINIPIDFGDDPEPVESDDVFEIDGDALVNEDAAGEDAEEASDAADEADADASREEVVAEEPAGDEEDVEEPDTAEAAAGPKPGEISREAVFEMMQELRQKVEEIERLTREKNDLYDKLLRRQAEFENFRRRGDREMQEAYGRARFDLMSILLPIVDNFELALHHADNAGPEVIVEGVELIYKQLTDTLGRLGLEVIDAEGQPFDPEIHEAVATEPNGEVDDHTVLTVMQRGYKLGDKLLRPARVKVAVQP